MRRIVALLAIESLSMSIVAPAPRVATWTDAQLALRYEWLPTCDRQEIEQSHRLFEEEDIYVLLPDAQI